VLVEAVDRFGTTFSAYRTLWNEPGQYGERLLVYDRAGEACRRCGTPIRRIVQGARSTFYCPVCQRRTGAKRPRKPARTRPQGRRGARARIFTARRSGIALTLPALICCRWRRARPAPQPSPARAETPHDSIFFKTRRLRAVHHSQLARVHRQRLGRPVSSSPLQSRFGRSRSSSAATI
jgi:hypothetical protein